MAWVDTSLLGAARDSVSRSEPASLRLNLFSDLDLDVVFERTTPTRFGYSLSGRLEGDPVGSVTLVVNGDIVAGTVHSHAGSFVIGSRNGVIHAVEEIVESPPAAEVHDPAHPLESREVRAGVAADAANADDGSELDVLILFTRAALRAEGGLRQMRASIDFAVAYANDAFTVSDVDLRMRLVAGVPVGYEEFEDPEIGGLHRQSIDLSRLFHDTDGYMDYVHELRDRYAADIVHLVVDQDGGGANVYSLDTDSAAPSRRAFGVSNSVRSGWALVHAAGRHMGIQHDRYVSPLPYRDYPPYARGYVNQLAFEPGAPEASRWRTIMSSYAQCNDQGFSCRQLPRYSNANQRYPAGDGDPLGVPGDVETDAVDGPANAARRLNETRHIVAQYRQSATRCDYRLSAARIELPWTGGTFSVHMRASPDCPWAAQSYDDFLSVGTSGEDADASAVTYDVEENNGPARVGYLVVAGETLAVFQSGRRAPASVCERTPPIRDAIVAATGHRCGVVSEFDLLEVVDISLRDRDISALDDGDFSGLRYLGKLDLSGNGLGRLAHSQFKDLLNLTDLSLARTGLTAVPTAVRRIGSLQRLNLSGNSIQTLAVDAFRGLSDLRRLDLSDNDLTALPNGAFEDMEALRTLFLSQNRLTDIRKEALKGPRILSGLYLGRNPLGVLREDAFTELPRILHLDLSHTGLASIAPRTFADIYLGSIVLSHNRIASLSGVVFPRDGVSSLALDNNALRALPAGMFTGFRSDVGGRENLFVDLTDNPGTPFPIHVELVRIDAAPTSPGTASVVVRVREAAPWTMAVRVTATGGASFTRDVTVPIGRIESEPFAVADNGIALLRLGAAPSVPGSYKGMETALGEPLRLFPFKDLDLKVGGTPFEVDLAAFDVSGRATTTATSSRPAVATVAVADRTLTVTPLREGRVTVTVRSRGPSGIATRHRFVVTVADNDGSRETANLLAVGPPLAGTLLDEADVDMYRLDLAGSAIIELRTSGPTATQGRLFDSGGTLIAADDASGRTGHNFRIEAELEAGTYYLQIRGTAGDYAVVARLADALDQGDTAAVSALLTLHAREDLGRVSPSILLGTPGRISPSTADIDAFRLDIPRNGTAFTVRSSGRIAQHARLLDSSLTEIASDDRGGGVRIHTQLDAGTYYLMIGAHETGNYRVLASADSANCSAKTLLTAGDIGGVPESSALLPVGGAPRVGRIADHADADVFRVDLAGRAAIAVRTSGATDTRGELFDASGTSIISDDNGGPGGHNFRIATELPAGIYYAKVSGAPGTYAIDARLASLRDQGDTAAAAALLPLIAERDLAAISPRMLLGTAGRIWPTAADIDTFRIDVPSNNTHVTVRTAGGTALRAHLVDASFTEIAADRRGGNVHFDAELDAGVHYLTISGYTTGNYRLLASTDSQLVCD